MIIRFILSVRERIIRPWLLKHYELTKDGCTLKKLKNKYQGKRCFLIGNGPSLRAEDLTKLYENNEITFAFNRIYNIFEETAWRPTYYISQDEKMLKGSVNSINQMEGFMKFIPIQTKWYHNINIKDAIYFNLNWDRSRPNEWLFSEDIAKRVDLSSTVIYSAVQFAVYMGIKEIYFIGVDHHFHISQNNKGEIIIDNSVRDYFTDKYNEDRDKLYIPNTEKSTYTYLAIQDHCDRLKVKVYNATRGGKLEIFERKNFEQLFVKD